MEGDLKDQLDTRTCTYQTLPWLVTIYQHLRHTYNRSFGVWRLITLTGRVKQKWQKFPVMGPDRRIFYIDLSDVGTLTYLGNGDMNSFEPLENELARRVLFRDSVVLDIGANVGVWARLLAQYVPLGRVFAFEPSTHTFALLQANSQNFENIEIFNLALSDKAGKIGLSGGPSVFRRLSQQPDSSAEIVDVLTLDQWTDMVGLTRLDFIKLDVEGAEAKVFLGAEQTLQRFQPIILFEQAPQNAVHFTDAGLEKCVAILSSLGYSLKRLMRDGSLSPDLKYSEKTTSTIFAVAKTDLRNVDLIKL